MNVRMMSANAIATLGPAARPAVSDLTASASVTGEDVQVLRASASALGAIGREAAEALSELTGEIAPEEVLNAIFGSFCIGK